MFLPSVERDISSASGVPFLIKTPKTTVNTLGQLALTSGYLGKVGSSGPLQKVIGYCKRESMLPVIPLGIRNNS